MNTADLRSSDVQRGSVAAATFKAAMRQLAASVTVITCCNGDRANGMTATAVCSVSSDPPLVLAVVNRRSRSYPLIREGRTFAINILHQGQTEIAGYFASKDEKSFAGLLHAPGVTGCPLIEDCAAWIECVLKSSLDAGTHTIFVGAVIAAGVRPVAPILYYDGRFARLETA